MRRSPRLGVPDLGVAVALIVGVVWAMSVLCYAGCDDDCQPSPDAGCCIEACPAAAPECCIGDDDPRPRCEP